MGIKTGSSSSWAWILALVGLTFLGIYLLNNIKPNWIEPIVVPGFVSTPPPTMPTDLELIPGMEEEYYEDETEPAY